jgi:hypothetical protein
MGVGDKWRGLYYYECVDVIEARDAGGDHVSTSWFKPGVGFVKYFGAYGLRSYTLN